VAGLFDFIQKMVTGDKPNISCMTILHVKLPSSPTATKFQQDYLKGKVTEVFFNWMGIVQCEFISESATVNEVLICLWEVICLKHLKMLAAKDWVWLHDTALAHQLQIVKQQFAKHGTEVFPHPPYSYDLPLCDIYLFPKLKDRLRDSLFKDAVEVQVAFNYLTVSLSKTSIPCH
jgi:hypothetical protein